MRLLVPYFLLLVLLFFVASGMARRSKRARRNVLIGGWISVAVMLIGTFYFMSINETQPFSAGIVGFAATAMLAYAVRAVGRRSLKPKKRLPPLGTRSTAGRH